MTVEDLEVKRDNLKNISGMSGEHREMIAAIYNVGIALVEVLNRNQPDGSIFEQVFGGKK